MERDSSRRISFEFRNSLSELDTLRRNLEEFGKSLGMSRKGIFQISLAMEEVFANIISYGYTDNEEHWIKITMWHQDGTLTLRIEDDGIPFNPIEAETPDLECPIEDREIGGLGCYLIKCLMNDVAYERSGNKNILTMRKTIGEA